MANPWYIAALALIALVTLTVLAGVVVDHKRRRARRKSRQRPPRTMRFQIGAGGEGQSDDEVGGHHEQWPGTHPS